MEVRLVVRIIGSEMPTHTRESFWEQFRKLTSRAGPPPGLLEAEIYNRLPYVLKIQIQNYIEEHPEVRRTSFIPFFRRRLRRVSVLGDDISISIKSLQYGSLEILLNVLAGNEFPLDAATVVHLLSMFAPVALSNILGPAPISVEVGGVTGSLDSLLTDPDERSGQAALMRRAFYLANFSLLVPVGMSLGVCYVVFNALVLQLNAADEERRTLVHDLLAQAAKVDSDRSQLVKDALDLVKESRTSAALLNRQKSELRKGASGADTGGATIERDSAPTELDENEALSRKGRPLIAGDFKIFGTGPNIDFTELAKAITTAAAEAGPKHVREVINGVGDGVDVARKVVGLGSDVVELYRRISPEHNMDNPAPAPALPQGTLLDRQVNFEFNSAELDHETLDALRPLAEKLRADRSAILIEGHADGTGTPAYNARLSQRRADAVRKFLMDNGDPASQMHIYGYGQGYYWLPYAPADAGNRRVRIIECTVSGLDRCNSAPAERPRPAQSRTN